MSAVDTARLNALLQKVEVGVHRSGWDANPSFWILYDGNDPTTELHYQDCYGPNGTAVRHGDGYAARRTLPPALPIDNAAHAAYRTALNFTFGAPIAKRVRAAMAAPGFLGYAVCYEAYGLTATADERAALGDTKLADVPGARELRQVIAVDVTGAVHDVKRRRGAKPTAVISRLADDDLPDGRSYLGAIPQSLAAVVAAIARLEPVALTCEPVGWRWDEQTVYVEGR